MTRGSAARWRRIGGAAFAAALTLLPLAALYWRAAPQPASAAHERVAYLPQWRPAAAMDATPRPVPAARPARAARRVAVPGPPRAPAADARLAPATPTIATITDPAATTTAAAPQLPPPAALAEPAPPAASAALKIDTAVMRAAAAAGKSGARRMAEASGAYFGSAPVTQTDQLGHAVAETAKPDCIRPGGSLLSIFVIAYEVARDKCK